MTGAPRSRLLAVDDEESILAEYRRIFAAGPRGDQDPARAIENELFGGKPARKPAEFDLVTCRQGDEAVAAVRAALADGKPFPLIYLDVRMPPGPNGIETAAAIRALDPNVHIAIVTGYSDVPPDEIADRVPPVDRLFYFEKPFRTVELRQLATALNAKWHVERALEAARDDLERQVKERTAELLEARDAALQASEAKTGFLTNMSHELRTPLNAVIGFSEFMLTESLGPVGQPKYREYLADIHESGKHLLSLINTILDLAKADSGKLTLNEERFTVSEIIATALHLVEPQAAKGEVMLTSMGPTERGEIYADRTKLVQVLANILSNAVKFTPAGGEVRLESRLSAQGDLVIRIADSGIGIRPEDIRRAMEPFTQLENTSNRKHAGTGLGLPLSVALVELHGGRLLLESTVGVGTVVSITIPRQRLRLRDQTQLEAG